LGHDDFRDRLKRASSRQLLELVSERQEALTVGEFRLIIRNPYLTTEVVDVILNATKLLAIYEVRRGICRHRRTSETVALRFIGGLFWRDLLEIVVDLRLSPAVRRVAERTLVERLKRLTQGEKIAIARRAPGSLLTHLMKDPSLRLISALLANPRLTEVDLLPMARSPETLPRVLDLIARDARWSFQYEVRLALCQNPQSPFSVIFAMMPTLRRDDLERVADLDAHSSVVRHRARELLAEGNGVA